MSFGQEGDEKNPVLMESCAIKKYAWQKYWKGKNCIKCKRILQAAECLVLGVKYSL